MPQRASRPADRPPTRGGGRRTGAQGSGLGGATAPEQPPPTGKRIEGGTEVVEEKPRDLTAEEMAVAAVGAAPTEPTLLPPRDAGIGEGAIGAWLADKRVNALWSINQTRNSWAAITGIGWKKLSSASDSGIVAMTVLASNAKQTQTRFDYRDEADGMIHEIYLW